MHLNNLDSPPPSATFGQDASFRLQQPIGAMSISPSGRDVVLASKDGLHIIDLDSPYAPPRYLPHRTPWEVADVQWSPFAIRDYWIVSTSNQKALVWNVAISGWRDAIEHVLHGHRRAITDINFSAHHPDILATCAVDSFVHAWDLRTPSRPAFSFSDWFAGATQVKWNRQNEHVIASSHDRYLHIWDRRKGAYPARTIEAHGTKIYGIDWNRFEPSKIVTCSLDKTIKFWNVDNPRDEPERIIETPFPVWRARHTPFGWGLCAMPQRGSSDLYLYDRRPLDGTLSNRAVPPVVTFPGHKGYVKEFLWRARGTIKDGVDHRDFQLVTWGSDGELRLHKVVDSTFTAVGYEKGVTRPQRLIHTRRNAKYRTFRDDVFELHSPIDLPGRSDSNQSHHHLGSRTRQSTNIGMSRLSVAQFRGWLNAGKKERRTGMHGKSTVRQDINPIAWMKNVKIASWDPDSLADEITQVGERFKKIEFESIDIAQRKAIMSLQGPWGENRTVVYTRVDFRFPRNYPRDAAAIVTVYKTNSIDEALHKTLCTEAHTISETYASRQRGCIEAIVRYLLNEQTMEQIVSWLLEEIVPDSKDPSSITPVDELSSDSDDDNIDGIQDPSNSSANIRVPLAKRCNALWSPTGALVCFFPQKPKETVLGLDNWGADNQSNRLFDNFGRLQTNSPARRPGNGTQPTIDDTASDVSDLSSTFSSSSSSSSESEIGIRDGFIPYGNSVNLVRQRSRSEDRSNKSTTVDGIKIGEIGRRNFVSVHYDVEDLLPNKKALGEEYKIFGRSTEVCAHNAAVAERLRLHDIASVWRLIGLLLQDEAAPRDSNMASSLQNMPNSVSRHRSSRLRRKDGAIDFFPDNSLDEHIVNGIRWGNNPLGSRYLIKAIFNHFERLENVQMLAMMSHILHPQSQKHLKSIQNRRGCYQAPLPSQLLLQVATDSLQVKHAPYNKFTLAITRPVTAVKQEDDTGPTHREPHHRGRNTAIVVLRPDLYQSDDIDRDMSNAVDTLAGGSTAASTTAVSVSTSPEDSRLSRRSTSGLPFAASKASLNALAQSFQHSPPSNSSTAGSSMKKFSPSTTSGWAGTLFGHAQSSRASRASQAPSEANSDDGSGSNLRGSVSLANLHDLRADSRKLKMSRGSSKTISGAVSQRTGSTVKPKIRKIKTNLCNQKSFDLDGHVDIPLLDPDLEWKYRMYRSAYADQLGAWGLFLQQTELLQFDGENPTITSMQECSFSKQVEIGRCCIECGSAFISLEKNGVPIGWHCANVKCLLPTTKISKAQVCSVCQQVVKGLSLPCLQCGHLTCYDCAQTWFALKPNSNEMISDENAIEDDSGDETDTDYASFCPTGCGCTCGNLHTIEVPFPKPPMDDVMPVNLDPVPTKRQVGTPSWRTQRHKSEGLTVIPGPETALGAMMALSRSRATSTTTSKAATIHESDEYAEGNTDDLIPWAGSKVTTLGRGMGGGLSRGLSNRNSDVTVKKA